MQIDPGLLIGVWKLVSAEFRREGEEAILLWGKDPVGFLFYTENGYVSATLTQAHRPAFSTQDLLNASQEELAQAAKVYLSYVGTYRIEEEAILHTVTACLYPNWTGETHLRIVEELTSETLLLRCPPMLIVGRERIGYLRWQKVTAS